MKILMINKFLYPNGGSETYIFKLGDYLKSIGHEVQYFGMEHEGRCVGNNVEAYTSDMDFHGGSKLSKLTYPIKTIYSSEARKKIRLVLDDFQPDVCHLNNFNFQLTPSIIVEIEKYKKDTGHNVKIVYTAHDCQLVCPNHAMQNPTMDTLCTKCLGDGSLINCIKGKCIHSSTAKSLIGAIENIYWNKTNIYSKIDTIISPSKYLQYILATNPTLKEKTVALHNFVDFKASNDTVEKKNYVLYFGRYSKEKGIETLLKVVDELPDIPFVFAGNGPLEDKINKRQNITNMGFLEDNELKKVIEEAKFTILPSEWFENCPFTVMESQMYLTPVLGADNGGIPELIKIGKTGELFKTADKDDLKQKLVAMYNDDDKLKKYSENCRNIEFDSIEQYTEKLINIYTKD
jgi:glycosyltransferase involved in cell wall biosynthesis